MTWLPPEVEPASIRAGDTLDFTKEFPDFPPAEWSCAYYFRLGSTVITVNATTVGAKFEIKADTTLWAAGVYSYQGKVTRLSDSLVRTVAEADNFEVLPNLATTTEAAQHARTVLASIRAVIERRATTDQRRYKIGGRELERMTVDELLKLRREYEGLVEAADRAEAVKRGENSGRLVVARFA